MNEQPPHPFGVWIDQSPYSRAEICEMLEIGQPYLSQILNRTRGVSLALALRIQGLVGDAFPLVDLLEHHRPVPALTPKAKEAAE